MSLRRDAPASYQGLTEGHTLTLEVRRRIEDDVGSGIVTLLVPVKLSRLSYNRSVLRDMQTCMASVPSPVTF
jgi:hypothetical protein